MAISLLSCVNCGNIATRSCQHKYTFSTCHQPICATCQHDESHAGKEQKILSADDAGKSKPQAISGAYSPYLGGNPDLDWGQHGAQQQPTNELMKAYQQQGAQQIANDQLQYFKKMLSGLSGTPLDGEGQGSGGGGQGDPESSMHWNTPQEWIGRIHTFFDRAVPSVGKLANGQSTIELDPTYNDHSCYKPQRSFSAYDLGGKPLNVDCMDKLWYAKTVFMNPPYGRSQVVIDGKIRKYTIEDFLNKMANEFLEGRTLENIALIPVATDTDYWQKSVFGTASTVLFVDKRIKFTPNKLTPKSFNPIQASALVYWGYKPELFETHFAEFGKVVVLHKYVEDTSAHIKIDEALKAQLDQVA